MLYRNYSRPRTSHAIVIQYSRRRNKTAVLICLLVSLTNRAHHSRYNRYTLTANQCRALTDCRSKGSVDITSCPRNHIIHNTQSSLPQNIPRQIKRVRSTHAIRNYSEEKLPSDQYKRLERQRSCCDEQLILYTNKKYTLNLSHGIVTLLHDILIRDTRK